MKKVEMQPRPVHNEGQIDIDSNAIIEASAGTGKTHAIENLVVGLLIKGKVTSLDKILVVTYTEKAAGELKDRIRNNIRVSLKNKPSEILQISLDNFDTASIFTIHGFCNKVLQEYAFENGEQFSGELIDDAIVYQKSLSRIMREIWPERYGSELQSVLKISKFPGSTASGISAWGKRVIEIAVRYQPKGSDTLIPAGGQDILKNIREMELSCHTLLNSLVHLVGCIDEQDIKRSELCIKYSTLNINKNCIGKRTRIISAVLKLLKKNLLKKLSLSELSEFLSEAEIADDEGFRELDSKWNKSGPDYNEKLPNLPHIIGTLEQLRSLDLAGLENMLASNTILDLKQLASEYKKLKGLISYDDMVNHVHSAIADKSSALKSVLQKRYRYALVDEFQDTDMLQWNIFREIFLESERNRLFIIGDPKQAIYGFRGADINAYYTARDEMLAKYGASYYSLNDNWRSSPALINAYNKMFADGNWFDDSAIQYLPSYYPAEQKPGAHTDKQSLFVVECGTCSGSEAKFKYADFIVRELTAIIDANPGIALKEIAILVTKWKEAEAVEETLKKARIKYSFYKKEGLYQSREALELNYVLASIASPHDIMARKRALMSRFFNVQIHTLNYIDGISFDHPISLFFEKLISFAVQKKWSRLFQSILEDSGILYRTDIEDHDRTILNYRTVSQNLEIEAYRNNYSIEEINDCLNGLRVNSSYTHESHNIQKIDLEQPGVQLLTIHASKGLQFRIVFIAGGFTRGAPSEVWTYHQDRKKVFDLIQSGSAQVAYVREASGEEERLFYVALTRARDRLYIPVYEPTARARNFSGILGKKLPVALRAVRSDNQVTWLDSGADTLHAAVKKGAIREPVRPIIIPDPLFPDPTMNFIERKINVHSFSGLKTKLFLRESYEKPLVEFGKPTPEAGEDDLTFTIVRTEPSRREIIAELPRSKETGLMLHEILEHLDFHHAGSAGRPDEILAMNAASAGIINAALHNHMKFYADENMEVIRNETLQILWNTLHARLNESGLVLGGLHDKLHEVEFYYSSSLIPTGTIPDISYTDGFIHGFIDMIFKYKGQYYIVDWKSNYIEHGYDRARLEENIKEMHYDLQILIYSTAVIRWLKLIIPEYSYNRHFGGVFYLYLRGMNINNPDAGIYFCRPDEQELSDLSFT